MKAKWIGLLIVGANLGAAVAARAETATVVTVRDAIAAAVDNNLTSKLAIADDDVARAQVLQAASSLLPNLLGTASQSRIFRQNLAAEGISFGGIGPLIGPYNVFDARVRLTQTLFDWSALKRYQSAGAGRELADRNEAVAREQVASAAALAFVEALRAHKAVAAAVSNDELAQHLLSLARDESKQGTVTGVDVVRAKTRASDADVNLLKARVTERSALLRLKRVAGWPLAQELELKGDLEGEGAPLPPIDAALTQAAGDRAEISAADLQVRVDDALLGAAEGGHAPTVGINGDYGLSGNLPDASSSVTGSIGASLSLPIFDSGLTRGRVAEARAEKRRSEERLDDVRAQVEEDVRLAYESYDEASDEVKAARQSLELSEQELRMAQDQYVAGTTDNIAVITAQTELAQTRDAFITALAEDWTARINLAASLGHAREIAFN
jgi:outer membrane protein TolC